MAKQGKQIEQAAKREDEDRSVVILSIVRAMAEMDTYMESGDYCPYCKLARHEHRDVCFVTIARKAWMLLAQEAQP